MYKLKDEPYSFGIKNISHREFNETPNIKRQVIKLIDENNVRGSLLENKEKYKESPSNRGHGTKTDVGSSMNVLPELTKESGTAYDTHWRTGMDTDESSDEEVVEIREAFGCKKSAVGSFIDMILSIILAIIFIIFLGYMIWISCFDRWNNETATRPSVQETFILEPEELDVTID